MALHQSGEDYLETILVLQKQKGMVRSVDVARHRNVSKPSVCHAYLHGQFTRASVLKGTTLCGGLGRGVSAWDHIGGEYYLAFEEEVGGLLVFGIHKNDGGSRL